MKQEIKADIARLRETDSSLWTLCRGILSQGFQALFVYRVFHALARRRIPTQPIRFIIERIIEITTGISIPAACRIGPGMRIHHFGGIIFHPTVQIGENATIYHGVTIGDRGGIGGAARIGDHVLIGAGAKIIGEVTIGDHCRIGANAVVNKNLSGNAIAYGNPCIIRENTDHA